ncbi:hypothetical protein [Mycolicibacterium brisbanense]
MNEHDADIAAHRHAAEQLAWELCRPPVATVVYIGTAAAAMRNFHLVGGGDTGYTFSDSLIETLLADPLGVQASAELGLINCLRNEQWVGPMWEQITTRVADAPMPQVTATERFHRRAAVEYALDHARFEDEVSLAAFAAFVEVMAAARVRWHLGEFDFVEDMDPADLIRDVVAAEPVAATADAELDEGWKRPAAQFMSENWDAIREKAADLEAAAAIEAAEAGPEQQVESARRGARRWMQAHNITDPDILAYGGALAAGRARWLQAGADPEQLDLFEVRAAELGTAGAADRLTEQTRDLARQVVTGAWAEIARDTAAS